MRTFDFAPLYRATVGFDQIADMMDRVLTTDAGSQTYPPITLKKPPMMPGASRLPSLAFRIASLLSNCARTH